MNFTSIFQNAVTYSDDNVMTAEQLLKAFDNVSTAQVAVIPTRVKRIKDSLAKEAQLYIRPVVCIFDNTPYLVSGRHRAVAVSEFCNEYGINAAGKVTKYVGDINDAALAPIEPTIAVEVIYAKDLATVAHLQLEYNGSRSMTAAETNLVKAAFTKLTALAQVQMATARKLMALIDSLTFNTALSIAKAFSSAFPRMFVYSTDEQLDMLVSWFSDFYYANEDNIEVVPTNISREYKVTVKAFLASTIEIGEEDEVIVEYVQELYAQGLEKPVKSSAKDSKVAELQRQIEELTARLQQAG